MASYFTVPVEFVQDALDRALQTRHLSCRENVRDRSPALAEPRGRGRGHRSHGHPALSQTGPANAGEHDSIEGVAKQPSVPGTWPSRAYRASFCDWATPRSPVLSPRGVCFSLSLSAPALPFPVPAGREPRELTSHGHSVAGLSSRRRALGRTTCASQGPRRRAPKPDTRATSPKAQVSVGPLEVPEQLT